MERIKNLLTWITVEPIELLYVLMFTTSNIVRDNLILDKICLLNLKYSDESCYNLTHGLPVDKNVTDTVQSQAANIEVWDGILVALPAVIFSLFVGAWSDSNGRKGSFSRTSKHACKTKHANPF